MRRGAVIGVLAVWLSWALAFPASAWAQDRGKSLELIKPGRIQLAKEFQVRTPDNGSLKLGDFRGKVVFLNFWATWCPPCKEEMPGMERLHQRYRAKGLAVVGLSVDSDASLVPPFLKEYKITFPIGLDPKMTVADRYGVRALPSTFLIDKGGRLTSLALGPRDWDSKASHAVFESLLK